MTISRLSPDTIRLLGSSCTISTPSSVVKELVDNSIDAGATSVEIIIASNTVEKIQISDNGYGISTQDFAALGCRASTSKLRSFDDLTRGTKTLGFRGEALAAVNSVAEKVTVKTRTEDPGARAQEFKLHPGVGGAVDPQVAARPVGTTVTVERLFGGIPVRRQHAVKAARKTIAQIKDLLLAYAFARPQLKISLKVPWEPGRAWAYHPSPKNNEQGKGGLGVALQMFGHKFSSECVFVGGKRTLESQTNQHGNSQARVATLQALMPAPDCKADVVKGKGAFISVDSRPITSTRGTAKKIVSLFRSYLGRTKNGGKFKPQSNPFLWLNIECSPGNYDPNVAPLKDEVLFTDEKAVLDRFEDLCRQVYKEVEPPVEVEDVAYVQHSGHAASSKDAETISSSAMEEQAQDAPSATANSSGTHKGVDPGPPFWIGNDVLSTDHLDPGQCDGNVPWARPGGNHPLRPTELITNQAHTGRKMNMAREESDSTYDNDAERATVRVPSKFVKDTQRDSTSRGIANFPPQGTGQQTQGIHQFFPPMSSPGFPIATNDTATSEKTPMQQWEAIEGREYTAGGLKRRQPYGTPPRGQDRDLPPRAQRAQGGTRLGPRYGAPGNIAFRNRTRSSDAWSRMESMDPLTTSQLAPVRTLSPPALRTPPPSHSRRQGGMYNPPFRAVLPRGGDCGQDKAGTSFSSPATNGKPEHQGRTLDEFGFIKNSQSLSQFQSRQHPTQLPTTNSPIMAYQRMLGEFFTEPPHDGADRINIPRPSPPPSDGHEAEYVWWNRKFQRWIEARPGSRSRSRPADTGSPPADTGSPPADVVQEEDGILDEWRYTTDEEEATSDEEECTSNEGENLPTPPSPRSSPEKAASPEKARSPEKAGSPENARSTVDTQRQGAQRERSRSIIDDSESEEDLRLFLNERKQAGLEDPRGPDAITRQSLNKRNRSRIVENESGSDEDQRRVHGKRKQPRIVEDESDSDPLKLLLKCVGGVSRRVFPRHAVELTKLPLETVREGTGTWDTTTTLDCFDTADSQTWYWIGRSVDTESESSMLDFKDMADVIEVGDRLKRVADEWVAKQDGEVSVEFSLRHHGTGKHRSAERIGHGRRLFRT